ncbi:telomere repeat-binding protein 5 isoform X2 [Cynara cardunculus var. scolymus]|uniref:telomere repeat-binding protein 5 isoform X2 n=1 Tax=Cynara cardunculus var. scolymus TaxID=59895 RepID=UPI000D6268B1|nr:telomere repeat-binding protein 5 isoform X2 [Cynara cardunculus var. scolymus]
MVLQKRLEYGFNGYQVPPTPRAPRSARKRVKKNEDHNQMYAFDLLATIAGKLLLEGNNSADNKLSREETVKETTVKTEEDSSKANDCDQESCNKSFFVSEIIPKALVTDTCSGPASGITVSDCSDKVPSASRSLNGENVGCKIEDINDKQMTYEAPNNGKPPVVNNLDSNVNLVVRDDDENSSWCTQPQALNNKTFRPPSRIGDRRIRRLLASKQWKVAPKLNNGVHFNTDADLKPVSYHSKKTCYKHQRSLRDYPFKKRRLYQLENPSNSDNRSGSPRKGSIEDDSSLGAAEDPAFQAQDSHVKLKIKSFRVPELFIEIPETATVSSLKRTVMEAVTAIFSGELHVGVMLQGKRIRDDNKTLLQTGICHDNKLDALGFTLEPNQLQVPPSQCPEDRSVVPPPATPKPLTRYSPPQSVANQVVIQQEMTNSGKITESDDDNRSGCDSRALVTVPAIIDNPVSKSKQAEVAQRRIRRPFSVSEVEALVEAVEKLGTGRWRDVKLRAFDDAKHRTYVDLKDKWKTLVHTARISPQQRRGEPVPQELLDRVLEAHAYWSNNQFKTQTCRLV